MHVRNVSFRDYKTLNGFHHKVKNVPFGADVKFESPLSELNQDTHKSLNLYMNSILHSTIEVSDEKISNYFTPIFKNLVNNSNTEDGFYSELSAKVKNFISQESLIKSNDRKNCYADRTMTMLQGQNLRKNPVYLDVGCANAVVTKSISESLNIEKGKTYGLDIDTPISKEDINILKFDGINIPSDIPSSDFVTLFTVLHHIKNKEAAENLLKSVYDNMNEKAYLLIREHEAKNKQGEAFWKVVHSLNTKVMGRTSSDLDEGVLYLSSDEWETILNNIGFKKIKKWEDIHYDNQSSYFLLVRK